MSCERDQFPEPAPDPQMRWEIRRAEGVEAQRLRLEQARAILEVAWWVAQRRSGTGSASET